MLKVTLHAGKPSAVSHFNLLGRLDIGYSRLDARADYKALLFTAGLGESPPVSLLDYPRWSASIWDLVARMVCLSISHKEAVWPEEMPNARKGAFIENLSVVVEHWPDGLQTRRSQVASAHIAMTSRRCNYRATFTDDILGSQTSQVFRHTPNILMAWDLLTRAYAQLATDTFALPARPTLYTPIPFDDAGKSYVSLDTVQEPARTGCLRWMAKQAIQPIVLGLVDGPCVTEQDFVKFLRTAV